MQPLSVLGLLDSTSWQVRGNWAAKGWFVLLLLHSIDPHQSMRRARLGSHDVEGWKRIIVRASLTEDSSRCLLNLLSGFRQQGEKVRAGKAFPGWRGRCHCGKQRSLLN